MYKIFFGDRYITLGETGDHIRNEGGIVKAFKSKKKLNELVDDFSVNEKELHIHLVHDKLEELRTQLRSCFRCIDAGGGVVFREDGDFLAILRNGLWDLPKGKLDAGENFEEAALREVEEETGLAGVKISHLLCSTFHTYSLKGELVLKETCWYEMEYSGTGEPVLEVEEGISDCCWVKPGDIGKVMEPTYASIRDVLDLRFPPGSA